MDSNTTHRPFAIPLLYVLYLSLIGAFFGLAIGLDGDPPLPAFARAACGLASLALAIGCVGLMLRARWTRGLCVAIHVTILLAAIVRGVTGWPVEAAAPSTLHVLATASLQLVCIGTWFRVDVARWFAARRDAEVRPAR